MDIAAFLGRLHPMVVHLPIGFLLIAAVFDWMSYASRYRHLGDAVPASLLAGFVSAVIACVFGYLLSLSAAYDDVLLSNHRNAGIMLALSSGIWLLLTTSKFSNIFFAHRRIKTAVGIGIVLLLLYTGHEGGSLTHGADYLSFDGPSKPKRAKPPTVADALVFDDVVLPVLERRCESCHRRGKRKGELIVSSYADLMKGGENGVVIMAGNPGKSELYRRITLDPAHEDFMPTDGKPPLTNEETAVIKWWIESAQASMDKKVAGVEGHEEMLAVLSTVLDIKEGSNVESVALRQPNPDIPLSADMTAVENLRKRGVMVRVMLHAPVMLDVTLPAGSGIVMKEMENDLRTVAQNVVWLNLSDNNLSGSDLSVLKEMINLEKLRLERNPVSDDLVDMLKGLRQLEALNINDTEVTDKGYAELKAHPSLKRIYRWSSTKSVH